MTTLFVLPILLMSNNCLITTSSWYPREDFMGFSRLMTEGGGEDPSLIAANCGVPQCSLPARMMSRVAVANCLRHTLNTCSYKYLANVWGKVDLKEHDDFCSFPDLRDPMAASAAGSNQSSYNSLIIVDFRPLFWHELLLDATQVSWHDSTEITLHFSKPAYWDCPVYEPVEVLFKDTSSTLKAICAGTILFSSQLRSQNLTYIAKGSTQATFRLNDLQTKQDPLLEFWLAGQAHQCGSTLTAFSMAYGRATITQKGNILQTTSTPSSAHSPKNTYWALAAHPTTTLTPLAICLTFFVYLITP